MGKLWIPYIIWYYLCKPSFIRSPKQITMIDPWETPTQLRCWNSTRSHSTTPGSRLGSMGTACWIRKGGVSGTCHSIAPFRSFGQSKGVHIYIHYTINQPGQRGLPHTWPMLTTFVLLYITESWPQNICFASAPTNPILRHTGSLICKVWYVAITMTVYHRSGSKQQKKMKKKHDSYNVRVLTAQGQNNAAGKNI